jgi:hypothetical protein
MAGSRCAFCACCGSDRCVTFVGLHWPSIQGMTSFLAISSGARYQLADAETPGHARPGARYAGTGTTADTNAAGCVSTRGVTSATSPRPRAITFRSTSMRERVVSFLALSLHPRRTFFTRSPLSSDLSPAPHLELVQPLVSFLHVRPISLPRLRPRRPSAFTSLVTMHFYCPALPSRA